MTNTGDRNTGHLNAGDLNTGRQNTGDQNTGDQNTGRRNAGSRNTGNLNTGHLNAGDLNAGDRNTGDLNTGRQNTGHLNTGNRNAGNRNTGDQNTGDRNAGSRNTGSRNTGSRNTGYLNSITPINGYILNQECEDIHNIDFPDWFYFKVGSNDGNDCCIRMPSDSMSEEEKKEYKTHDTTGGYIKVSKIETDMKVHRRRAFEKCDDLDDLSRTLELPNFSYEVFEKVSGITKEDLDKKLENK